MVKNSDWPVRCVLFSCVFFLELEYVKHKLN